MREIISRCGKHKIIVDAEDYDFLSQFSWRVDEKRNNNVVYGKIIDNKYTSFVMRRIVMAAEKGESVMNKSGNELDNRKCNLLKANSTEIRRLINKGRPMKPHVKEMVRQRQMGNQITKGRRHSDETRRKMSEAKKGDKGSNWKGGVSTENRIAYCSLDYRTWRKDVFERDGYTCQKTKIRGHKLHPHHVYAFAKHHDLRYDVKNGITLSISEHKRFHGIYGYFSNLFEIEEFLGRQLPEEQRNFLLAYQESLEINI
jgi:hypothetical protein